MRINKENADLYGVTLSHKGAILDFIKENYPPGPLGELLFKADASQCGLNGIIDILENNEQPLTKYNLIIMGDAKAKYNKFALTSISGVPFYCGNFLEPPWDRDDCKQHLAEANALVYAIRLCRDYCYYKKIKLSDFTLLYLSDSQPTLHSFNSNCLNYATHMIKSIRTEIPINLKLEWIRGVDNLADKYTLAEAPVFHPRYDEMDKCLNRC